MVELTEEERQRQLDALSMRWNYDDWHVYVGAGMIKWDVTQAFIPEIAKHIVDLHNAFIDKQDEITKLLYTAYRWILVLDEPTMQQRIQWIDEVGPFIEKYK